MKQLSPDPTPAKLKVFVACLLAFTILTMPIAAVAAPSIARTPAAKRTDRPDKTGKTNKPKSAVEELFVNPPVAPATETSAPNVPGPKPEPAPEPFAPPVVGSVTATMTAALTATANNLDGKADPGDTINYTVQLGNTSGSDGTGISFSPGLDSHTTFVPGSIKSTPICFDQSGVSTNEDTAKAITLTGEDPDGDAITFSIVTPPTNGGFGATTAPNLTYTPNANFFGSDSFTFRVNDGTTSGAGNNGNSNETCTVSITVNAVNDAPTFTVPGNPTAVNEDAGAQSVSSFITGVRPAQVGNTTEDTQTVSFVITNNTNPGLFSSAPALNVVGASYPKTATLTYTSAANQNGTATITYHAHDNGGTANSGVDNSADQTFTITVNAVNDPPVVVAPAAFAAQANMKVTGLTGLLGNVNDNADNGVNGCVSTTFTVTSGSIGATSPAGGIISNVNLSTGTFDFEPPPGVTGDVTFTYTVSDTGCGSGTPGISAPVTVHVTVSGPVIWFVNPGAGPDTTHTGTLNNPFQLLASANTAMGVNAGQRIFVYTGTTTSGVGVTLTTSQWLIGQGATNSGNTTNFDTFMGITPPANTIARPAVNGTRPTIQGRVQMNASNTRVQGIDISPPAGTQGLTATSGAAMTGMQVGVSSAQSDVTVSTSGSSGTNAMAVSLNNAGGTFSFISVSSNGGQNGIGLTTTNGSFTVLGAGGTCTVATPTCTGGSIQSTTAAGINISATASVSLTRMKIQNSGTSGISATSVSGFTFDNGIVTDSAGGAADEGILLTNASGTVTISNSAVSNAPHNGVHLNNFNTNITGFSLTNTTISCAAGQPCQPSGSIGNDGLLVEIRGTSVLPNGLVSGSTFSGVRAVGVQVQANDTGRIGVNNGAPTVFVPDATNSFVVQSNTFTGNGQGIDIDDAQVSNVTFQVLANTINGISTASGGNGSATAINAFTSAGNDTGPASHSFIGKIDGNFIGTQGTKDSGSGFGNGIRVVVQGNNTQGNITVSNNTIRECAIASPMNFIGQNGANTTATQNANTAHFKIINNTLPLPSGTNVDVCGTNTPCIDAGIFVLADELTPVCNTITGNNVFDATLMNGGADIYLAERAGPPAGAQLTVVGSGATTTFLNANNTLAGASKSLDEGGNTTTVASCGTFVSELQNSTNSNREYLAQTQKPALESNSLLAFIGKKNDLAWLFESFNRELQSAPTASGTLTSQIVAGVKGVNETTEARNQQSEHISQRVVGGRPKAEASADVSVNKKQETARLEQKTRAGSPSSDRVSSRGVSESVQKLEVREQRSDVRSNHARRSSNVNRSATSMSPVPFSGGTFPINGTGSGFSLPNGKTITIKFSVTLNNPPNLAGVVPPKVSAQGTLSGAFIGNPIVTDDPGTVAANDATVTLVDLFDTTVAVASSQNPSFVGQNVQFTATVSSPGGVPTGSVQFKDGASALGAPITLTTGGGCPVGSACATTPNISSLTAGSHVITADYTDSNGNFDPNTGTLAPNQQVNNKTATTTTVLSSLNPSNVGDAVTFTAQVNSASATGTVQFWDGPSGTGTPLGGAISLTTGGSCPGATACASTAAISNLTAGPHTITADYSGDVQFNSSTGKLLPDPPGQQVNKKATTTTVTSAPNPSNFGQSVTFTAHVSSALSGTPTGTVQFWDGASGTTALGGPQPVNGSGDATFITSSLSAGTHNPITADYSGDAQFAASSGTEGGGGHVVNTCAANVIVANNTDAASGSLRDALSTVCDGGTITFDPSVTSITLTTGELAISKNVTVTGTGAALLTVSGNNASRVFNVAVGKTVTISGMTITAGKVLGANGAAGSAGIDAKGGAVINAGTLTLSNVILSGSHATGGDGGSNTGAGAGGVGGNGLGGGIYNSGTLTLTNTTVNGGNSATGGKGGDTDAANTNGNGGAGFGGGVYSSGTLTLTNSTISANSVVGGAPGTGGTGGVSGSASGGGVYNDATAGPAGATITGSTISGNTAGVNGGGIANVGTLTNATLTITNSTISGNGANNDGGGIYNAGATGTTTLTSVTVTGNTTDKDDLGGGAGGGLNIASGTFTLKNTIVAGNLKGTTTPTAHDITGTINTAASASSYNLIGDAASSGGLTDGTDHNIVGNAGVGTIDIATVLNTTLADNGGPTKTHALIGGSPALEKGNAFSLTTDQRGFPRPVDFDATPPVAPFDDTDIGAFESQIAPNAPGAPNLDAASDSGANSADDKTNVTTNLSFTIPGVVSGATVQLFRDGAPVASGVASGITIQLTDPGPLTFTASGTTYSYTAKQSFGAATSVASTALPVLITIIPDAPVLDPSSDSGTLGDGITNDTSPTFNITNVVNTATVKLFRDGVEVASGTAAGTTIQLTDPSAPNGTFTYTAKQIFNAVTSDPSAGTSITITIKPDAPDLIAASDSGSSSTDNYTNDTTPTFNITGVINGANVELLRDGTSVANNTAVGTSIQLTDPGASAGMHTYKARQTVGITLSPDSDGLDVTIDNSIGQPSTPDLITADDSNINNDDVTNKTTPTFTGTAEANSSVQVFATGVLKGSGTADNAGAWSITLSALADGPYNITAVATDLAGNVSIASAALPIVIDTIKPTVAMSSAVGNPTATTPITVTVTFSESVSGFTIGDIVPGNGTVGNFAGGPAIYTFDLTPTSPGAVSADIAGGVAIDLAGNSNTAATQFNRTFDPSALSVTITPVAPDPRNTSVSSIQIVFNKAVTGFDLPDLTLKLNGGANLLTGAQTLASGDGGITWTLGNLSGLTGTAGTYVLKLTASGSNIKDAANNPLTSDATESWVTDTTAPDVTINQAATQLDPVTGPTASTVINFTAIFTEPVVAGSFTNSDVTISGTAGATVVNVSEIAPNDGTHFNVAVEGMTQSGTVIADIPAGAAQDTAGNGNTVGTFTDHTVTFNKDDFTTFVVNTTLDADDGACTPLGTGNGCTLREAINAANADAGAETITFNIPNADPGFSGGVYTITLLTALPNISDDLTITGLGANVLTIKRDSANVNRFRIFTINSSKTVNISGVTITGGRTTDGNLGPGDHGGGISNLGTLTLTGVAVSGNRTGDGDGDHGGDGGGIFSASSTLTITNSTISGNQTGAGTGPGSDGGGGGGINGVGTLTISNSTISGNQTGAGGGGGHGGIGGGILVIGGGSTMTLTGSTITGNSTGGTGGFGGGIHRASATVTIKNTIVGGNTAPTGPDIEGPVNSEGYNLIQSTSGATITETLNPGTNITGQDPQLNALADNGGPTFTHSLQCTSPAIDKGKAFGLTTDQRGGVRPFDLADAIYPNAAGGDGSDIGAFETQTGGGCQPVAVPPNPQPSTNEDTQVTITLKGTYSQNFPLTFTITQSPAHGSLGPISAPVCNFNLSETCTATVNYTPSLNFNGLDSFKFKVSAGGLDSDEVDVNVTVISVNDPPVANGDALTSIAEDSGVRTIPFADLLGNDSPGPADESGQTLTVISVSNPVGGTVGILGTNVQFTPTANYFGPASFQYKIRDNGTTNGAPDPKDSVLAATVTFTIDPVADTPLVTNATTLEDTQTTSGLVITRNPADGAEVTHFQITGITGGTLFQNNGTTPVNNNDFITVAEGGAGLRFTPTPDSNANGGFQVQASLDNTNAGLGGGLATATITVTPVNDAPSFTKGADQTVNENAGAQTVAGWATNLSVGPANEAGQTLTFQVTGNTNPGLFSAGPAISPTGTLTYTPATNINGSAIITIVLKDDGGTANGGVDTSAPQTFTITVKSVNDAPSFTKGADQTVNEDAGAQSVVNWATNISAGPANESGQTLTFLVTGNTNPGLFSAGPAVSPTGTLTYTPAADANGSASITIVLKDDGGTANGGVDTSAPQTFTVTVNPINDAPVNHVPGPQNIPLDALFVFSVGTGNAISISDVDAGSDPVQVTLKATDGTITLNGTSGLSFTVGDGTDDPLMTFTGSIANINAALEGMKNLAFGSGVITITTNDLGHNGAGGPLSDTDTIQVTVNDNLAPVLLTIPGTDRAIAFDSVTFVVDPFSLVGNNNFTADHRTHITLFALHAQLRPGETASAITAEADVSGTVVPLIVESVMTVPNFDWLTQIVVKFPDGFSTGGGGPHDAKIRIRLRGQDSNQAVIIVVPAPKP